MKGQETAQEPYSYHTFSFPFILEDGEGNPRSFKDITDDLKMPWVEEKFAEKELKNLQDDDILDYYRSQQYFHEPVNRAIYGGDTNDVVKNYLYDPQNIHNKAVYCIDKNAKHFELNINQIRLKIYNTGVGIIYFECENIKKEQRNLDTVKDINELGRRVTTPFLPTQENGLQLCADQISINVPDEKQEYIVLVKTNFRDDFPYRSNLIEKFGDIHFSYIANFIVDLISNGMKRSVHIKTARQEMRKRDCFLCRALDDRMYVACIVRDDCFVRQVREVKIEQGASGEFGLCKKGKKKTKKPDVIRSLYEIIFIDKAGEVSCPTERMMVSLLNKQVYDRWLEYGTLYGISHHSFICVTGEDDFRKLDVIEPFLTLYVQMALLCLAQRCSIILFQKRAPLFTNGMSGHGYDLNRKNTKKLLELQENLIAFLNQLQFFEVTSQEQGAELYDMICSSLYIDKEKKMLEEQINLSYQATTVNQEVRFSQAALVISVTALILTVFGSVISLQSWLLQIFSKENCCFGISLVVVAVILVFMVIWYFLLRKRRKK